MRARFNPCLVLLVLAIYAGAGCRSASPSSKTTGKSVGTAAARASKPLPAKPPKLVALSEQSIRAHAHYAAGLAHDLSNQPELALEEFRQSALSDPSHERVVLETASRFLRAKKPDKAIEVLNKAASLPKATGSIYAWLGLAYAQADKKDAAIKANKAAIKKLPQSLAAYQNLAQLYLQNKRTNDAFQVLDSAARQATRNAGFLLDLSELLFRFARSSPSMSEAARTRSKAMLERASALKPGDPLILQKLAEGYLLYGDLNRAEEIYAQLLKDFPDIPMLRAKLAEIYVRNGRKEKAAEQLEAIAKEQPTNPQTHFFIGSLALEDKQPEKAAEAFERAILLAPDLEPAYYELAAARLSLRKPQEALAILEKARTRFKLNFVLEFYSGMTHSALKQYADAVKHMVSAELLAKASEPSRLNHFFYFQLGAVYERHGDFAESEKHFRKCLELSPKFAEALNYLGYMWVDNGVKLEEAKGLIEKAVELEPKNAAFLDSLAWAFFKLKQPKEALVWMLKAIENTEEPDATLYDHLGDIYADLQRTDDARDAWRKSLKIEASDKIKDKLDNLAPKAGGSAR